MATECQPLWPLPGVLIVNGRKNSMGRRREVGFFLGRGRNASLSRCLSLC